MGDNITALYQPEGGLVDAALGNSTHIQLARAHGATIKENCTVLKLEPKTDDLCIVSGLCAIFDYYWKNL